MLEHVLQYKGEAKKFINKIIKNNLYRLAQNESGFDSYVVLNNIPQWKTDVSLIENGSGIVSLKILRGYVDENEKTPQ